MKIFVMEQSVKERSLIREALEAGRHQIIWSQNEDDDLESVNAGDVRFIIADAESSRVIASDLIRRVHAADIPPVYILLLSSHKELKTEADDVLHKPFTAIELQMRVAMGQRILSLVDSLSHARNQLENTAIYDPLTGMMNQVAFNKFAKSELERARRASSPLSIIALDIDNFKALRDRYGAETGDHILRLVAENIRERSRSYDCVGRWTGPEFVIALLNVSGDEAEKIARRIITGISFAKLKHDGVVLDLNVSAGIAVVTNISEAAQIEPLIQHARQALAQAKEAGGFQVHLTNA
jgi:diguanylate cyclase (GGDEF)-like protein